MRIGEIDHRHKPALLPSRINCVSVTAFHSSSLRLQLMFISKSTKRKARSGVSVWSKYGLRPTCLPALTGFI